MPSRVLTASAGKPRIHTIIAAGCILASIASACVANAPDRKIATTPNSTTRPSDLNIATDNAVPTGVRLSSTRPTDARLCVGWGFGCGITENGTVQCWGTSRGGELGIGASNTGVASQDVRGLKDVTRIVCGEINSTGGNACALTKAGVLSCWGTVFTGGTPKVVLEPKKVLDHIVDVKTGAARACALSEDGTLRCWGSNYLGQLGDGSDNPSTVPIPLPGLGPVHDFNIEGFGGCAIGTDGEVRCWGAGPCKPTRGGALTPRIVPGLRGTRWVSSREALFVINAEGDLVGYNCSGTEITQFMRIDNVVRAYDSVDHLCAVRSNDSVLCTERGGLDAQAQMLGIVRNGPSFVEVPMLKGAKEIALTRFHGCASFGDGLRCFGDIKRGGFSGGAPPSASWLTVREPARDIPNGPVPVGGASSSGGLVIAGDASPQTQVATGDFVCPSSAAPAAPTVATSRLFAEISPSNRWTCLDGTVTGLLVTSSLGLPILSWSGFAVPLRSYVANDGNYLFARNGDGFRALYFATPTGENKLDLQVNRGDGKPYVKLSSMLRPHLPNPWNLSNAAHIVRVRVNDGFGSNGGLHFIASDVKVLDKTADLPIDPTAALTGFLEPLANETSPEGQHWRKVLTSAVTQKMKTDRQFKSFAADVPAQQIRAGFHATWDEKAEELHVGFFASLVETRTHTAPNPDPDAGQTTCHAPPGADCAPRHIPSTISLTITYRGEYAVRATFSKTGALVKREELPVDVSR